MGWDQHTCDMCGAMTSRYTLARNHEICNDCTHKED